MFYILVMLEASTKQRIKCLAQGHNAVPPVINGTMQRRDRKTEKDGEY